MESGQQKTRLFIKYLPEAAATDEEIKTVLAKYGTVNTIDIKKRKQSNLPAESPYFAYIDMEIKQHSLQKCFKYFTNNLWHGENVEIQVAKENFLDRIKREREESGNRLNDRRENGIEVTHFQDISHKYNKTVIKNSSENSEIPLKKLKTKTKSSLTEETGNEKSRFKNTNLNSHVPLKKMTTRTNSVQETSDEESRKTEHEPVPVKELCQSEIKRVNSINQLIKNYQYQKSTVTAALANIDNKRNKKITFDEEADNNENESLRQKQTLFHDDDDDDTEEHYNFDVKAQFDGDRGQKLLKLQSKYANDKRFTLTEKFLNDEDDEDDSNDRKHCDNNKEAVIDEKERQFQILEEVLGGKTKKLSKPVKNLEERGTMLRFDPTQEGHSKFEIKETNSLIKPSKKTKKKELSQTEQVTQPVVSKEVFYKVNDIFKGQNESVSFLSTFGNVEDKDTSEEIYQNIETSKQPASGPNPFRYDSSDDEPEDGQTKDSKKSSETKDSSSYVTKIWSEPFFFKHDDFRFQEGYDFLKRMEAKNESFAQQRQSLKEIVKTKVKNSQRKHKLFKRKLGGNKRRKIIRVKKAMSR